MKSLNIQIFSSGYQENSPINKQEASQCHSGFVHWPIFSLTETYFTKYMLGMEQTLAATKGYLNRNRLLLQLEVT